MSTPLDGSPRFTAKMRVNRCVDMGWGWELELTPDYAEGRNEEWAHKTPAGMVRLTIKGSMAAEIKVGQPYTVTFEPED